jgi:hypothetical protein
MGVRNWQFSTEEQTILNASLLARSPYYQDWRKLRLSEFIQEVCELRSGGILPIKPARRLTGALLVKGDLPTPAWFNEFITGGGGYYGGPKGIIRM